MNRQPIFIGCAGWSLNREHSAAFAAQGTHLQRYASQLTGVEINSSFHRPHRQQTYARWAASVPSGFRFSVKMPKQITHVLRLQQCNQALDEFVAQCSGLEDRLGCLLVQLPPSLVFDESVAVAFFTALRSRFSGHVVLEPRHESWVGAQSLLVQHRIAQVAVDPSRISTDMSPRGWAGLQYWRLHGSPRIYYSAYELAWLKDLAFKLQTGRVDGQTTWCIFDNTASSAAMGNALTLLKLQSLL
ncbi:DUF72 domain-containing protein [Pseudomonas sp. PCH199]|uniref:DUF72 domain-containing protein n=1 Tax=unclassified Pseudomonas TaxID=196821 RepID=UPI000BCF7FF2|nr:MULTISPECIES: DUF72 domain-containing protein [unclassified Pseudomonas]MCW8278405.1 DUF72 domain-containing protein [Pseudomonas sp. PCH199]PAM81334.1 hypothetical protein CES87_25420 [Pseudomonas sp. ERMR1:02]